MHEIDRSESHIRNYVPLGQRKYYIVTAETIENLHGGRIEERRVGSWACEWVRDADSEASSALFYDKWGVYKHSSCIRGTVCTS